MRCEISKPLAELKNDAIKLADDKAGEKRAQYITTSQGQDIVYARKLEDAKNYKNAGYPEDAAMYYYVNAEAVALNITHTQAADYIISKAAEWDVKGAGIEAARQTAKLAINTATSAVEIWQAINQLTQALGAI